MNKINEFIKRQERKNFPFTPDNDFYDSVRINKKRWAKLMRNEVSPTITEVQSLAEFFNVSLGEIIEAQ